jgi:dTDP-D-glucose 4,6-dehydratase
LILWCLAGESPIVYGDGRQTRDFTYVLESADILATLALHEASACNVFNVCRGQEVSVLELAEKICRLTGTSVAPRFLPNQPSDLLRLWGDASKPERTIGRKSALSIDEGLARTVDWFRTHVPLSDDVMRSLSPQNWQDEDESPRRIATRAGRSNTPRPSRVRMACRRSISPFPLSDTRTTYRSIAAMD